jgi:hypothetical protein
MLLITYLLTNTISHNIDFNFYTYCDYYNSKDSCIENFNCVWCYNKNITNNDTINNGTCFYLDTCVTNYKNNTNELCYINSNTQYNCNILDTITNFIISFLLLCSAYSFIYTTLNVFERTYDTNKCYIIFLIGTILAAVYIPAIIFWISESKYFIYYLLFIVLFSILSCVTNSAVKYRRRRTNGYSYERIN